MLNVTGLQPIVADFELMFFTFLYILPWIGVTVILVVIVVLAIRLIGKATKLPVDKIFESIRVLSEQKAKGLKVKNGKQNPFCTVYAEHHNNGRWSYRQDHIHSVVEHHCYCYRKSCCYRA